MKLRLFLIGMTAVSVAVVAAAQARQVPTQQPAQHPRMEQPMANTPSAPREALAIRYPATESVDVLLQGTERLPRASGEAEIEREGGTTEIELNLDEMKAANRFGGDINTYVLWSISPEGMAANLGEVMLDGNSADMEVTTPLDAFALIITAEPHFMVRQPSQLVVLESKWPAAEGMLAKVWPGKPNVKAELFRVTYRGFEGSYTHDWQTLDKAPEPRTEERTDIAQARTAIKLAEAAGASEQQLAGARQALQQALDIADGSDSDENMQALNQAREAVRLAAQAQHEAEAKTVN